MLVKVDGKTYINNITIINNTKKKKKTFTTDLFYNSKNKKLIAKTNSIPLPKRNFNERAKIRVKKNQFV